jgi:hypothetical protein
VHLNLGVSAANVAWKDGGVVVVEQAFIIDMVFCDGAGDGSLHLAMATVRGDGESLLLWMAWFRFDLIRKLVISANKASA